MIASNADKAVSAVRNINWTNTAIAKAGLYTIAAAGTIYGITWLAKLAKKFFYTPDAKVVEQAEQAYKKADHLADPLITVLANFCGQDLKLPSNSSSIANEDMLAQLALAKNGVPFNTYITELKRAIRDIKYYDALLPKRMAKLLPQVTAKPEAREMYDKLKIRLDGLLPALNTLYDYLNSHKKYFELDDAKAAVYNTYYTNGKNPLQFVGGSSYPRIHHATQLTQDIKEFEQSIIGATWSYGAIKYPALCGEATRLANGLKKAHLQFVSNDEYTQELRACQEEQRKAEESRQQTELQKKQLHLQEQKLQELKKANELTALGQRREANLITQQDYERGLESINSKYLWSGFWDTVSYACSLIKFTNSKTPSY